jgi:hypothetical protein
MAAATHRQSISPEHEITCYMIYDHAEDSSISTDVVVDDDDDDDNGSEIEDAADD